MQILINVRRLAMFMVGMVLSAGIIFAQEMTISGKVTSEGNGTMPGVSVEVQGTTIGSITGQDGVYTVKVPGPEAVLVFSSTGYVTRNVTVGSQSVIDVVIMPEGKAIQEVLVTWYTAQRRRDITGSVGIADPAMLVAVPYGNVGNQLQGRTSGVTVIGDGRPGETSRVRIRGFSSFQNNDPLYVIDGVPTQDVSSLNPNDVASISILKDDGAAAIYGSRASNGVIIITTKRGSSGTKITYSMYSGLQLPGNGPKGLLNTHGYADLQWLVYKNDGTVETHPIYGPSTNSVPALPAWAANTNWYKAITHCAPIQNHDLTLSGGNDNAKFFAAIGVFRQDGIVIYTDAEKYTARINSEFTLLKNRLKVGENITLAYRTGHGVSNLDENSPIQQASYRTQSIIPVKITIPVTGMSHNFVPGEWGGTGMAPRLGQSENIVARQARATGNNSWSMALIGSAYLDVEILQGLNFRSTLGGTFNNGYWYSYSHKTYENAENNSTSSYSEGAWYGHDRVWTNIITLDKTFGSNRILAVGGYEAIKYGTGHGMSGQQANYFTHDVLYRTLSNGETATGALASYYNPTKLVSQFLRADYSFMDKYLLSGTIRCDGSSRFGSGAHYGLFPSFSIGWHVSDEPFLKAVGYISDLKLRFSYGKMGNQFAVSPQNQFIHFGGTPVGALNDLNGTFTSWAKGFRPISIGNPDNKWETNVTADIGLDAGFLNNKLGIRFDWYSKRTKHLLFATEIIASGGSATLPYLNSASMSDKGIEMEITYKNRWGDLGFDGSAIVTTYKNKINSLANDVSFFDVVSNNTIGGGALVRNAVGQPMSSFYGYRVIGLFQSDEEIASAPTQDGAAPGFFRFADIDGDGKISPADRTFIGNPNPKFTYGFNLAFTWKNFDLTAFLYGSQGNDIFNLNLWWIDFWPSFQGQKSTKLLNKSWLPARRVTQVPKASNVANFSTNGEVNSYYIENGSFLRMKSLQIGYTIPETITSRVNIKSLRVYIQAVNLFKITRYSGPDPELGGSDENFGIDSGNYPLVRQFLIGLDLDF